MITNILVPDYSQFETHPGKDSRFKLYYKHKPNTEFKPKGIHYRHAIREMAKGQIGLKWPAPVNISYTITHLGTKQTGCQERKQGQNYAPKLPKMIKNHIWF